MLTMMDLQAPSDLPSHPTTPPPKQPASDHPPRPTAQAKALLEEYYIGDLVASDPALAAASTTAKAAADFISQPVVVEQNPPTLHPRDKVALPLVERIEISHNTCVPLPVSSPASALGFLSSISYHLLCIMLSCTLFTTAALVWNPIMTFP